MIHGKAYFNKNICRVISTACTTNWVWKAKLIGMWTARQKKHKSILKEVANMVSTTEPGRG